MSEEKSLLEIYRSALFTLTGAAAYYALGFPIGWLLSKYCGDGQGGPCDWIKYSSITISVLCFPLILREWNRVGRWVWTVAFPYIARVTA